MKVLITGGAGFIGSHLAEQYVQRGDEVHIMTVSRPVRWKTSRTCKRIRTFTTTWTR